MSKEGFAAYATDDTGAVSVLSAPFATVYEFLPLKLDRDVIGMVMSYLHLIPRENIVSAVVGVAHVCRNHCARGMIRRVPRQQL